MAHFGGRSVGLCSDDSFDFSHARRAGLWRLFPQFSVLFQNRVNDIESSRP